MAALLKKVPVLIELVKPKLNVFVKYAKVLDSLIQCNGLC